MPKRCPHCGQLDYRVDPNELPPINGKMGQLMYDIATINGVTLQYVHARYGTEHETRYTVTYRIRDLKRRLHDFGWDLGRLESIYYLRRRPDDAD